VFSKSSERASSMNWLATKASGIWQAAKSAVLPDSYLPQESKTSSIKSNNKKGFFDDLRPLFDPLNAFAEHTSGNDKKQLIDYEDMDESTSPTRRRELVSANRYHSFNFSTSKINLKTKTTEEMDTIATLSR
jgi:hypothetical protein